MNIILIFAVVLLDIFFWGYLHERKGFNFFWETAYDGHLAYPLYRIFQFAINVICLWFLYPDWFQIVGFLAAHYFLTTDYFYYLLKGDIKHLKYYEGENLYWLNHFFQFGSFIFVDGFRVNLFYISAFTGLILLILSNYKLIC